MIASHIQYGFLRQATGIHEGLDNTSVHLQLHICQACVNQVGTLVTKQ